MWLKQSVTVTPNSVAPTVFSYAEVELLESAVLLRGSERESSRERARSGDALAARQAGSRGGRAAADGRGALGCEREAELARAENRAGRNGVLGLPALGGRQSVTCDPGGAGMLVLVSANFGRLALGCIEANFCK